MVDNLKSKFKHCLDHPSVKASLSAYDLSSQFNGTSMDDLLQLENNVKANPANLEDKYSLASLYIAKGRHEDAIRVLLEIVKVMNEYCFCIICVFSSFFLYNRKIAIGMKMQQRNCC
jgi:hypothetical protein